MGSVLFKTGMLSQEKSFVVMMGQRRKRTYFEFAWLRR